MAGVKNYAGVSNDLDVVTKKYVDGSSNLLPYTSPAVSSGRFALSPDTAVYRLAPAVSSGVCEIPIPDVSAVPSGSAYYCFELEVSIGSGAETLVTPPSPAQFDSSESYSVGDYTLYSGSLYRCTTAHSGAWSSSDFSEVEDAPLAWNFVPGRELPASGFAGTTVYMSCRMDCAARTVLANVWMLL